MLEMGIVAVGGERPVMPDAVVLPATEWRAIASRVGVGGTWPVEYRLMGCPGAGTGKRLGSAIVGLPCTDDACEGPLWDPRGMGGALWMYGCRLPSLAVRGLITISAGFVFPPPICLLARRRAKLIGTGGSACEPELLLLAAEGCK